MFFGGTGISDTKKKVFKNIAWAITGKIVALAGALIAGIIVARFLGKEQYGIMNYVISIIAIFQVFADFGLDSIQIREESKAIEQRDTIIGTVFCLRLFFAIVAFLAIILLVFLFEDDSVIRGYIVLYAFSMILNTTWVARNHFTSIVWNEYVVKTEISRSIIGIILKLCFVMLNLPLIYFICLLLFDSVLLASGYLLSYSRKIGPIRAWRFSSELAVYLIKQSFPLLLSGIAIIIYNRIDQVMIGKMVDQGSLGIYSVAVRFIEMLVFIPTILSQTVSPILVDIRQKDYARYQRTSRTFMNVTVFTCVLLAIATSLLAYPLVYFTFGETYIEAAAILSILSFKVIGDALSQTSGQLIIIEGIQKYAPVRNIMGGVACVILNLFFITRYGITGAAYVAVFTILISGTLTNGLIPAYRNIFRMQMKALLVGWRDVGNIKSLAR